jgi:uncharacterized membrane protein
MYKKLAAILVLILVIDGVYLQFIYRVFKDMIRRVQGGESLKFRFEGAVICYLALAGLLYYFIVKPGKSAFDAGLLGFGTYAVYESTSYALLKDWDWKIALIDSLWGGVLFYLTTSIIYLQWKQ